MNFKKVAEEIAYDFFDDTSGAFADLVRQNTEALRSAYEQGVSRAVISREDFRSILCEYTPSIAEDSGLPTWSQGEMDVVYDDIILGKGVWSQINERSKGEKV